VNNKRISGERREIREHETQDNNDMKNKRNPIGAFMLLILGALAGSAQALLGGRSLCVAANNYDAAVETTDGNLRRTNDAAVSARHLLWKEGATAGTTVALNGAADKPLGTIDNVESLTGQPLTVLRLGLSMTRKMVAAGAVTVGQDVYTAANGKVQAEPAVAGAYYLVGRALSASGADNDIIEVETCLPLLTRVVANAADLAALKVAMASPALLKFLQS
jgi:hypothetical protein